MEAKELTQAKRELLQKLIASNGFKETLNILAGLSLMEGRVKSATNDAAAADLLPMLPGMAESINFQRRMKYVSIDGRPPQPIHQAHANANPPPELIEIIKAALNGPAPRPTTQPKEKEPAPAAKKKTPRPPADKQGNLF